MKKTLLLTGVATLFALNASAQYYSNSTYYPQSSQPIYHKQHKYMLQKSHYHNNMIHKSTWNIRPVIGMDYSFDGYGYVASQSIKAGTKIDNKSKLEVLLGNIKPN